MGVGVTSFYYTDTHVGGWWAAIVSLVCGILGIVSYPRGTVIIACIVSVLAMIISLTASILDGLAANLLESQRSCMSPSGEVRYFVVVARFGHSL